MTNATELIGTKRGQAGAPARNAPCHCGSGRKYKLCCGNLKPRSRPSQPALAARNTGRKATPLAAVAELKRANALILCGCYPEALKSVAKALKVHPEFPEAANSMGCVLARIGDHKRAIVCYAQSLSLWPENVLALNNLGASLQALGRTSEAIDSLRLAIHFNPGYGDAYLHLSKSLFIAGRYLEVIDVASSAVGLGQKYIDARLNSGCALKQLGRLSEAAALFEMTVPLRPKNASYLLNLGEIRREQGRIPEAVAAYRRALAVQPDYADAYSNLLYTHSFTRDISPAEELAVARGWELAIVPEKQRAQARNLREIPGGLRRTSRRERAFRLGVVSAELGTHAVAEFLEPLLTHLHRDRFHLTLFPTTGRFDKRAERLWGLAHQVISLVGMPDDAATERIRNESIDLLLDTSGHTAANRLGIFARRAAPVQCTYIGYWSTTGLTEMDWFISDGDAPPDTQDGFSEGLWRLPRIAVAYQGDRTLKHDRWMPNPNGKVRLGSLNRLVKIREETLALWAEVLKALPYSTLVLEDAGIYPGETQARIRSTLQSFGVDPGRVSFIPYEPGHERHMSLYNEIDIALDTIPFNSGTTAFDALWMGVPLVVLDGNWIGGRMGASILRALGRREWIASSPSEFVSIVERLASDPGGLQRIHGSLREEMATSPLCDGSGLSAALADAFESMYDLWWTRQVEAALVQP